MAHLRATMVAPADSPPTVFLPPFVPLRGLLSGTYAPWASLCDPITAPGARACKNCVSAITDGETETGNGSLGAPQDLHPHHSCPIPEKQ